LQAIGRPEIAMRSLIITGVLKTIFNYSLTSIPFLNIRGAAIGTLTAFAIGSALNIYFLQRLTGVQYEIARLGKLLLVTVVMGISARLLYIFLQAAGLGGNWSTLAAIVIGVSIYGVLLLAIKEFDLSMLKKISR
jgi:stage V sporulation protein B